MLLGKWQIFYKLSYYTAQCIFLGKKNNPLISKGWATHMKIHQCIPEVLIFNKTPKCVGSILTLIKYMI